MIIDCKIGTLSSTQVRVKRLRRVLEVGEIFQGFEMDVWLWRRMRRRKSLPPGIRWSMFEVTMRQERRDGYFYFLNKVH